MLQYSGKTQGAEYTAHARASTKFENTKDCIWSPQIWGDFSKDQFINIIVKN